MILERISPLLVALWAASCSHTPQKNELAAVSELSQQGGKCLADVRIYASFSENAPIKESMTVGDILEIEGPSGQSGRCRIIDPCKLVAEVDFIGAPGQRLVAEEIALDADIDIADDPKSMAYDEGGDQYVTCRPEKIY